jgi:diguanylate cyclase (GGDEF)-like protein/putative nucleotidyltransferase with HDIG domain
MRFGELPFRLRAYILGHFVALAALAWIIAPRHHPVNWGLVAALLVCTAVFSTWKVELTVFQGRMTPTFAIVCLALLLKDKTGGVQAAILCATLGGLVSTLVRTDGSSWKIRFRCPEWYRLFFNVANCAIACACSALFFETVLRLGPGADIGMVLGVIAFTGVYFLLNTLGISLAIAFQQDLRWLQVWQQNFLWTAPGFFASASAAAGIQAMFKQIGAWSLMFLPPLYLIYYSYRLYMDRIHLFAERVKQDMSHISELNQLNRAIIASLATAIDAKDRYTCSHIDRVQHYATALARAAGMNGSDLEAVITGALVHDIGKLGIPDHILGKPGKLTTEEFERIQTHVTIGVEILSPIPFPFPVVDVVRSHHERWDGLGYPDGLKGEEIPIGGRIISIVDVYDALTSNRPYRRAMTPDEAMRVLKDNAGKQFDPHLVDLFERVLPEAAEIIARLEAERLAHSQNASGPVHGPFALTQISQAAAEMAAVCDVAHALAEQETLEDITRVIVDRALALLPADTAILYLRTEDAGGLVAATVQGKYAEKLAGMTIRVGEGVSGWVAENQQPRVNVSAALDVARRFTPEENLELSAATAVPLVHGPDNLGVLTVYTTGYSVLSGHHLHVLNILAEHAAAALQNTRRMERHRELAFTDPLTGLENSRGLLRHMERLLQITCAPNSRGDTCFSVVMLDLDRFKEVNDTLGHLRGDDLLRQVADRLIKVSRPGDILCRYAGDEFVLLLPGVAEDGARRIAHRVRCAIDAIPAVDGRVQIGASVGTATFPEDGADGRSLIHAADHRMYEDKFHRRQNGGPRKAAPRPAEASEMAGASR